MSASGDAWLAVGLAAIQEIWSHANHSHSYNGNKDSHVNSLVRLEDDQIVERWLESKAASSTAEGYASDFERFREFICQKRRTSWPNGF